MSETRRRQVYLERPMTMIRQPDPPRICPVVCGEGAYALGGSEKWICGRWGEVRGVFEAMRGVVT